MKYSTTRLSVRVALLAVLTAAGLPSAVMARTAQPPAVDVLLNARPGKAPALPAHAKAGTAVSGTFNLQAFSAGQLSLSLPDGTRLQAALSRVAKNPKAGTESWVGSFENSPGSLFVFSKVKGVVTGVINHEGRTFEIIPAKTGHLLFEVDVARLKGDTAKKPAPKDLQLADAVLAAETSADVAVQDVLIFYTDRSQSRWGAATLESMVTNAMQASNQAYLNSQVNNMVVNTVAYLPSPVQESGAGMQTTLDAFRADATVSALREQYAADMVVLISEDSDWCGYAYLWFVNGVNTVSHTITNSGCLSNQTLAHEFGHLQGLDHNREDAAGGLPLYPYSYGYRVCATNGFRDIMSYSCTNGTSPARLVQFSNPDLYYNGYATGVSYELSPATAADASRSLRESALRTANYRVSATQPPAAPSSLSAPTIAYNRVNLSWVDNATNETGFKVERSADGVVYAEIASLGQDVRSFADVSVAPLTRYFYRVAAYNNKGVSAYSNALSVTTPDVPPPPPAAPASVSALNNANGTATVSWVVGTTTATSFEVRRETYNSRKGTWGSATVIATVPVGTTSVVNSTGNGTFRFSVRAINAGGSSAYVTSASVTVTGAKKGRR